MQCSTHTVIEKLEQILKKLVSIFPTWAHTTAVICFISSQTDTAKLRMCIAILCV